MINENVMLVGGTSGIALGASIIDRFKRRVAESGLDSIKFARPKVILGTALAVGGMGMVGGGLIKKMHSPVTEALTEEAYQRGYDKAIASMNELDAI